MRPRLLQITILSGLLAIAAPAPGSTPEPEADPAPDGGGAKSGKRPAWMARLEALGYLTAVASDPDPSRRGVAHHDPSRTSPGRNVYCSVRGGRGHVLDMQGETLSSFELPKEGRGRDCLLEPIDGGFLVVGYPALSRIDLDGTVRWTRVGGHHHDVAVSKDGTIYALAERPATVEWTWRTLPILDQTIVLLNAEDGTPKREISLVKLFRSYIPERQLSLIRRLVRRGHTHGRLYDEWTDVFHVNTIEVLDRDVAVAPKGSLLICLRNLNLLAILDPAGEKVLWTWGGGVLDGPHHPSFLENGNLLVFDNGRVRGHSRVLEVDPASKEIVWQYPETPSDTFLSRYRGSAQSLSNGNLLVTESDKGRAFEITRDGEVVWDFWNPEFIEEKGQRRQIYRMVRIADVALADAEPADTADTADTEATHADAGAADAEPADAASRDEKSADTEPAGAEPAGATTSRATP